MTEEILEEKLEETITSVGNLPWPFLHKYFKVVGVRGNSLRVQCLVCVPAIKLLYSSMRTWANLSRHLKHRHPKKALAIGNIAKRRTWKKKTVKPAVPRNITRRAPRKVRPKQPVAAVPDPKALVETNLQMSSGPVIFREMKEEIISNASPSHVASDSIDSGLPDVDETNTNFEYMNPAAARYSACSIDVSSTQPQPQMCSVAHVESSRSTVDEPYNIADVNFLKSLLPDMIKMSPRQKHKFKLAILNAVDGLLYD
ncbi:uncharacterized protein [Anabrus simplex]|uniref:uncharacterized protein isoform X1 n=1 Tax=Anabrus simplex TaxID=316456 RepID=UPI0034DD097B